MRRRHRSLHRRAWLVLAALLPLILLGALLARLAQRRDAPPLRLDPP